MLYILLAIATTFPRTFIIKGSATSGKKPPFYPFSAILNYYAVIAVINEEATDSIHEEAIGTINEASIGVIIAPRNPPSCDFISCSTVLLYQLTNVNLLVNLRV